ncbi:SDR family NAD(P)-dependent oxidoreductase [Streptomyces sp. NPDC051561]|uniref:SDR family NAD(P)-dependent oxidoreductase n=1 Tax=Streptomyces sp. NPDC051561 TaxID=3365658 RepID=UPI0037913001
MPLPGPAPTLLAAYDLTGRTAFVTGAASGIGRAAAVLLTEAGATVHCADRDPDGLAETARQITKSTGGTAPTRTGAAPAPAPAPTASNPTLHTLDVTSRPQLNAAISTLDRLDILVTAAGIMHSSSVLETTDEDLDRILAVNFKGTLYACQEAAQLMLTTIGTGNSTSKDASHPTDPSHPNAPSTVAPSIVTLASGAADSANAGLFAYSATKAAIIQLTKTLATELGPQGIRVNTVAPGWIRTPMTARHDATLQHRAEATMARITPLGRVGEAEEVAHAILHLASDAARFTTGQIFRPNGGVAMPW